MRTLLPAVGLATLALLLSACPKNGSGSSSSSGSGTHGTGSTGATGTSASTGSTGTTSNPVDAGPTPCADDTACTSPQVCDPDLKVCVAPCSFDDQCGPGRICNTGTTKCTAAKDCDPGTGADPCASDSDGDYCPRLGDTCVCLPKPDGGDYCARVRPTCAPCTTTADCSTCPTDPNQCDANNLVYPSTCAPVSDAGSFCLRQTTNTSLCPQGFVPSNGLCEPQTGSCANNPVCLTDSDCQSLFGPGYICEVSSGLCKETCGFDPLAGASTNCPPGKVCDVLPPLVLPDAGIGSYGLGRCEAPCNTTQGEDCVALGAAYGLTYECFQEKSGEHRCRPVNPDAGVTCMYDVECPRTSDGGPYAGYCAQYQFECTYDCRNGTDPLTGHPYGDHDCAPPSGSSTDYKCVDNQCVEKTCVERGGAQAGLEDQFCCGEDRNHTGYLDGGFADISQPANSCPTGVDAGQYYFAQDPPWCALNNCQLFDTPDGFPPPPFPDGGQPGDLLGMELECNAQAGIPAFTSAPSVCIAWAQDQNGNAITSCLPSANGLSECPKGWSYDVGYSAGCNDDNDCDWWLPAIPLPDGGFEDGGVNDGGFLVDGGVPRCRVDPYPDGGASSPYCHCTQPEQLDAGLGFTNPYNMRGQCPDDTFCHTPTNVRNASGVCAYQMVCYPTVVACQNH